MSGRRGVWRLLVGAPCAAVVAALLAGCGGSNKHASVLPMLDARVSAHVLSIYRRGRALGNRPDVFAKVGDSNTAAQSFLREIGCGKTHFGAHPELRTAVAFFARRQLTRGYVPFLFATRLACPNNSFVRIGFSAYPGWDAASLFGRFPPDEFITHFRGRYYAGRRRFPGATVLQVQGHPAGACPGLRALPCELHVLKPSLALIMIGTNDLIDSSADEFRARLERAVAAVTAAGTIPVLSTIPPRQSTLYQTRVAAFNAVIAACANRNALPLWDFWRALAAPGMINHGMGPDQIHLGVYDHDPSDLEPAALRYGANLRNLQALQVLDLLRRRILARPS